MKDAKKPDLCAPRYRKKRSVILKKEYIEQLKKDIPEARKLTDDQIKEIILTFNGNMWKAVIENRDGVELPESTGHVFLGTCQQKKSPNVDFFVTKTYLKVIQHRNWESDSHLAKIFYTTFGSKYRFKFHDLWSFKGTRNFTRTVGKTYPKNWKKYIEVDPNKKIAEIYRSRKFKLERIEEDQKNLDTYNELDI